MDSLIKLLKSGIKCYFVIVYCFPIVSNAKDSFNTVSATSYILQDLDSGEIVLEKNSSEIRSIASITKLMTAVVVLEKHQNLNEKIFYKRYKDISSKFPNKSYITRSDLLLASLMSSDNGATKSLAENYPGGETRLIWDMNQKARALDMNDTSFTESTGLSIFNRSTATDLLKLLKYAYSYKEIRDYSTTPAEKITVYLKKPKKVYFHSTNKLVRKGYNVLLSKTGWIRASGGCLVMIIQRRDRRLGVILLNSKNTVSRIQDGLLLTGYNNVRNQRNFR